MATSYEWTKLFLENSKVIITIYALFFGLAGYTAYDYLENNKVTKEEVVAKEEVVETPVVQTETKSRTLVCSCDKIMQSHIKEFH